MAIKDLDQLHRDRVDKIMAESFDEDVAPNIGELFVSSRVVETLQRDKILLNGFRTEKVLALMPFSPDLYVTICPRCLQPNDFSSFQKIVASGLIIPILLSEYRHYPAPVAEFIVGRDHISAHEYRAYRFAMLTTAVHRGLCHHCAGKRINAMWRAVRGKKGAASFRE